VVLFLLQVQYGSCPLGNPPSGISPTYRYGFLQYGQIPSKLYPVPLGTSLSLKSVDI